MSADAPRRPGGARAIAQVFTTREIARLLKLSPGRVRRCVRAGFLRPSRGPRRRYEYTLRELLLLRATRDLLAAHVAPRRIAELIAALARQLDGKRDVTSVKISIERDQIVVSDGAKRWQPESGQLLLEFSGARRRSAVVPLDRDADASTQSRKAYVLVTRALALERRSPAAARAAYAAALHADPGCAPAHINLGRLLHEAHEYAEAEKHYRAALALDPEAATAAFNLAILAEDQQQRKLAIDRYRQALAIDPTLADAHRSLARLHAEMGKHEAARRHLRLYRTLMQRGGH